MKADRDWTLIQARTTCTYFLLVSSVYLVLIRVSSISALGNDEGFCSHLIPCLEGLELWGRQVAQTPCCLSLGPSVFLGAAVGLGYRG
jgi:hypothetical protein